MAMLDKIKEKAGNIRPYKGRFGCYRMNSVTLRCIVETYSDIKKGEVVHAKAFDTVGMYPNCVCLKEKELWYWADNFEIV